MEVNKELKIVPPEGMEYYIEDDTVKFRSIEKKFDIDDVYRKLFKDKHTWRLENNIITEHIVAVTWHFLTNCTSKKQAEKLIAINKLMNVAKYLNGDWKPNWRNVDETKYYLYSTIYHIQIGRAMTNMSGDIYFKTMDLAKQAIEILGEDTIKIALNTDY